MPFYSLQTILSEATPSVQIIDVGAMREGQDRYAGLLDRGLARVTGFEPNPSEYSKLVALKDPVRNYLPYFLGKGGPATFHVTAYPGCCSLYCPDPDIINLFAGIGSDEGGNFRVVKTYTVETQRLDDVGACANPDYMKLDVQGGELDVLSGAIQTLASVLVIEVEVEFVQLYRRQPLFGDVQLFLRDQGFMLHKFIDVHGRPFRGTIPQTDFESPISQLLWADAIFVRDLRTLPQLSPSQLLKAALILHDVYLSYDLVHYLLRIYDLKCATDYASAYRQASMLNQANANASR